MSKCAAIEMLDVCSMIEKYILNVSTDADSVHREAPGKAELRNIDQTHFLLVHCTPNFRVDRLTGVGRKVPRVVVYRLPRITASSRNAAKQPGVA
eukprot:903173-Prymnesium_polylepis.1